MSNWGLLVNYWPGTTTVQNTLGEVPIDYPTGVDQAIIPYQEGVPYPVPAEDPRFYPEVDIPLKRTEMRKACEDEITRSSFQSEALGELYNYDCRLVDQINLQTRLSLIQGTTSTEQIWASDGTRYEWTSHSAAQLLEVLGDMNDHIKAAQAKLVIKMSEIDLATSKGDLAAITW